MANLSQDTLAGRIAAELREPVPEPVRELAAQLAARAGGAALAVLYYGSTLRSAALDGMLDFYVLLDRTTAWPGSRIAAFANRLLPPNVGYVEGNFGGVPLRAKFALIAMASSNSAWPDARWTPRCGRASASPAAVYGNARRRTSSA